MEDDKSNQNADTQAAAVTNTQAEQKATENKNEGEKGKKSVAQKGEDGSITFKNQDELNGFISRMYAKGANNAQQTDTAAKQTQETQTQESNSIEETKNVLPDDYFADKIALAMVKAGVNSEKSDRAARLVDTSKILVNGAIDPQKLKDEIDAIIAEFPEMKNAKETDQENKGFKFGATQSNATTNTVNTTKPVAAKRWNRFKGQ